MRSSPRPTSAAGFTLIELMIVVAVITLLAAIAFPAYTEQVRSSRRAQAQAHMTEMQQCMERFNTANATYTGGTARCEIADTTLYNYTLTVASRSAFTIAAAPLAGQTSDSCGSLGLNQAGQKTHSSGTNCWK